MTEKQALVLDVVVGLTITLGSVVLLSAVGANEQLQFVAAMVGLAVTCLLIGAIDVHYTRKAIARGEDPDEL
jgi:flagellar biosynthesis component FlhA